MAEIMKLVLAWTCVGVFIATALITLLALVRVIRLADRKYLDRLFVVLIVEVLAIGVGVFAGVVKAPAAVADEIKEEGRAEGEAEAVRTIAAHVDAVLPEYERYVRADATLATEERTRRLEDVTALRELPRRPIVRPHRPLPSNP